LTAIKKSFCIVCIANYCRSPVAENLLKKRFGNIYEFLSAGISPISEPGMDPRSMKFLKENNINHIFHSPKNITRKMLNYFDKFLAVDFYVLNQLNVSYPKYKNKFLSLTIQFDDKNIIDPYQLQADDYLRTMNDIRFISENIDLEKL
jgi:protein-tyrosine-phosphatase